MSSLWPPFVLSAPPIQGPDVATLLNSSTSPSSNLVLPYVSTLAAGTPSLRLLKANGVYGAQTPVVNTNPLGTISIGGYDGSVWKNSFNITTAATEDWTASTHGTSVTFNAIPTGQNNATSRITLDGVGTVTATADLAVGKSVSLAFQRVGGAVSGGSVVINNSISALVIQATATLASYTVTLPATPFQGQVVAITANQTITSLTLSPNTGQTLVGTVTTLNLGSALRYMYVTTDTAWYPV